MEDRDWLPGLITLGDSGGDWSEYLRVLYEAWIAAYRNGNLALNGVPIGVRRHPKVNGQDGGFWHLITEGPTEDARTPALRRCERILWPAAMVQSAGTTHVACWKKSDQNGKSVVLALPDFSYVVVLRDRADYLLLVTAYDVAFENRRQRLRDECQRSEKC